MKLLKLSALAVAVLGSSAAMAATTDAQAQQGYQYDSNRGVVANTAGAVVGTGKTLFNTAINPAAVSAEIGTLGYGANIAWGVNDTTELTAGWNGFDKDGTKDLDASDSWINYGKVLGDGWGNFKGDMSYDIDMSNPYLGVNLRPWANNFTVGTGVLVPDNKVKASVTPTNGDAEVKINGTEYTVADGETVNAKIETKNKLAPYLTLGYRPNINQNWGGFVEAGAAYMGKLEAKVDVNGDASTDLAKAAKHDIEKDDVWYPIVKAGVTYRF